MDYHDLPSYTLIRSARRSLAIEIKPGGELVVRVPKRVSDRAARAFVQSHRDKILKSIERMKLLPKPEEADLEEVERLRARARAEMPGRVALWCERLHLKMPGVKITSAKKRWGSCSSKGMICFSYLLMRCPDEFIDYVALHEVAHLLHQHHGSAFYALIEEHMPDYRERIKWTGRSNGGEES